MSGFHYSDAWNATFYWARHCPRRIVGFETVVSGMIDIFPFLEHRTREFGIGSTGGLDTFLYTHPYAH